MTDTMLDQMFEESGILNRVIIVAVRYSGEIIDPLKNTTTLLMTAAGKEHASSGGAHAADLRKFGSTSFQDALPKTRNVVIAFADAKSMVAEREAELRVAPSNLKMFLGERIKPVIDLISPAAA